MNTDSRKLPIPLITRACVARVLPFLVFMVFVALRPVLDSAFGEMTARWFYPVQTLVVAGLLWWFRADYVELRTTANTGWLAWFWAMAAGVAVFVLWIHADAPWLTMAKAEGHPMPLESAVDWIWIATRIAGSALLVPIMEELFWRSFLMRWIDSRDFLSLPAAQVSWWAILTSSFVFGLEHNLWVAGVLAGIVYALLYRRGHLWHAIVSHMLTNFLLGVWVVSEGQWQFW